PDLSRWRRTRPGSVQAQMEGGHRSRARQLLFSIPRLCCWRLLRARMGRDAELARRRRAIDDVGRGRLCRHDRVRLQYRRLWQDGARRLLHHRSRNGVGPWLYLRAIHTEDLGFCRGACRRICYAAVADAALLPPVRRRPSELETKYLLLCLLGLGALAGWADSEAVLPAYLIGMVLAGTVGKDHALIRRLRTLTFGLLTPFYFIRAGSFVSVPALIAAPAAFVFFLIIKIATKVIGVYPVTKLFGSPNKEAMYTTLLMSTGLTFGTISSLFGLSHKIIDTGQYSA